MIFVSLASQKNCKALRDSGHKRNISFVFYIIEIGISSADP